MCLPTKTSTPPVHLCSISILNGSIRQTNFNDVDLDPDSSYFITSLACINIHIHCHGVCGRGGGKIKKCWSIKN